MIDFISFILLLITTLPIVAKILYKWLEPKSNYWSGKYIKYWGPLLSFLKKVSELL